MTDKAHEEFVAKLEKTVGVLKGKVVKTSEMGKKQLAYRIGGVTEAVFMNFAIEIPAEGVVQLEKKLTVDKEVLRHLLVLET
jgi:ribosomal protein S6